MTTFNPSDKVTLDIPLFIRLLEYAREDAKTDMDLHNVAEKAIAASETGKTLTMAEYDSLVAGSSEDQEMNEIKRMIELAGLNEGNNDVIKVLLQWINEVDVDKYKSPYDFKEAVKQKILSLKDK
jgi:tRNA threonylcarbamoyladenosine modification (KEOPS) complex Cgi121 subunit